MKDGRVTNVVRSGSQDQVEHRRRAPRGVTGEIPDLVGYLDVLKSSDAAGNSIPNFWHSAETSWKSFSFSL
jgi:hypothetical protein